MCSFVRESFNSAILDSGCTSNVCGQSWLECYINGLDADEKKCIIETRSDTNFKFGDGDVAVSKRKVTIPAKIGSTRVTITTDVIQKDLPLLFSKDAMKAAKTVLRSSHHLLASGCLLLLLPGFCGPCSGRFLGRSPSSPLFAP